MAVLTTVADVAQRLSLNAGDSGIAATISSAINAATPALESLLRTQFDKGKATDLFYVDPESVHPVTGFVWLKLSRGFISSAINCKFSGTLAGLSSGVVFTPIVSVLDRGHLMLGPDQLGKFVSVAYSYGFSDSTTDDGVVPDATVPEWLQEVAINYAIKIMSTQQVGDPKPELSEVYKFVDQHAANILNEHLRNKNGAISPL